MKILSIKHSFKIDFKSLSSITSSVWLRRSRLCALYWSSSSSLLHHLSLVTSEATRLWCRAATKKLGSMTGRLLIGKVEKGDGLTIATVEMSQTKKAKGLTRGEMSQTQPCNPWVSSPLHWHANAFFRIGNCHTQHRLHDSCKMYIILGRWQFSPSCCRLL